MVATHPTLLSSVLPRRTAAHEVLAVLGFSLLIALGAQVAIPLPFTPVPATLQTLAVLLAGATLGSRRGALAVLCYLAEGAAGLPVFAGGLGGAAFLLGPTGGYLAGFAVSAFVVGLLAERGWDRRRLSTLAMLAAGTAIILGSGFLGMLRFATPAQAFLLGVLPFLVGDVIKIALVTEALPRSRARWS